MKYVGVLLTGLGGQCGVLYAGMGVVVVGTEVEVRDVSTGMGRGSESGGNGVGGISDGDDEVTAYSPYEVNGI